MNRDLGLDRGRVLILGPAVLLVGDLFLPWQRVSLGSFSYSWNAWHGDKGFLLGALAAALIAWVTARSLGLAIPERISEATITLAVSVLVVALAAVKNIHDMDSAWGSYVGVVLAAALVAAAWQPYRQRRVMPVGNAA